MRELSTGLPGWTKMLEIFSTDPIQSNVFYPCRHVHEIEERMMMIAGCMIEAGLARRGL